MKKILGHWGIYVKYRSDECRPGRSLLGIIALERKEWSRSMASFGHSTDESTVGTGTVLS